MGVVSLESFVQDIIEVWNDGGKLMWALAILAFAIYFYALEILIYFRREQYHKVDEGVWVDWIKNPEKSRGRMGEIIRYSQNGVKTSREIQNRFEEIKAAHLPRLQARILLLGILVTVPPLMGLLGTVMGMLTTFKGLGHRAGRVVEIVAEGVSEALITTQTGLIIAIPGYIFVSLLIRHRQEQAAFLERLESLTLQHWAEKPRGQRSYRGKRRMLKRASEQVGINISPMIDMVFILLIFFIVTTVFIDEEGLRVDKVEPSSPSPLDHEAIIFYLHKNGRIRFQGRETSLGGVGIELGKERPGEPLTVILEVESETPSALMVQLMDTIKRTQPAASMSIHTARE